MNSTSKSVVSYGWEAAPLCLEVEFSSRPPKANGVYQYPGVPQDLWHGLIHAPSAGEYLNRVIKPHYPAVKVQ
jgi:hypothetical protein